MIVKDYLHDAFDVEYEYVNEGKRDGRRTSNIGTMNDGTWHFLSVSWSGTDKNIHVYVDTVLKYSAPIQMNTDQLSATGIVSVGGSIKGNCKSGTENDNKALVNRGVCGLVEGTHFIGSIQGVRIWGVELTETQRSLEMQWPFAIEKPSALDELRLFWRFNNVGTPTVVKDLSTAFKNGLNEETSTTLANNDGVLTRTGAPSIPIVSVSASTVDFEEAPCVEDEEWYFVAPQEYLGNIKSMYDGSIEFKMRIAQSSGKIKQKQKNREQKRKIHSLLFFDIFFLTLFFFFFFFFWISFINRCRS